VRLEVAIMVVVCCVALVGCFELAERERPEEHMVRIRTFRRVVGSVLGSGTVLLASGELASLARPLLEEATVTAKAGAPAMVLVGQLLQWLGVLGGLMISGN